MAQQKYSDNMAQDAASVANAAIQTTKDAKTVAAAAGNLAAGNVVGAAKEVIKNPHIIKMILAVILAALFLIFVVFITPIVLLFSIPGSIISAIQDATNHSSEDVGSQWMMNDADPALVSQMNDFWSNLSTNGNEGQSSFTSSTADYTETQTYDVLWGESNLQITALDKYFRRSYKNAVKRANKSWEKEIDEDELTKQALSDGIESSEYVKFTNVPLEENEEKGFQKVAFYIMAMDAYKYTLSNDSSLDKANEERLTRMMDVAKEISPNGIMDIIEDDINTLFNIKDDSMWVASYNTTSADKDEIVGYEKKKEWHDTSGYVNGKWVQSGYSTDTDEDDPDKPIVKTIRTYTTKVSLNVSQEVRDKLYEKYGIDKTENLGDHSTSFSDPLSVRTGYDNNEDNSSVKMTAADIIETQVDRLMKLYNIPVDGITGSTAGAIGVGGSANISNLSEEEIQNILASLNSGSYTAKQQALVSKLQEALRSPLGLTGYMRSIGCTVVTNMCQAFVADFYSKCGQTRISYGSAINAYKASAVCKKGQPGYDTPPDGASVYIGENHVGIYIGGYVIDSVHGKIQSMPFETWKNQKYYQSGGGYLGWGFNGWDVSS